MRKAYCRIGLLIVIEKLPNVAKGHLALPIKDFPMPQRRWRESVGVNTLSLV